MLPVIARERKEDMRTLVRIYSRAANVVTGERGLQIGIIWGKKHILFIEVSSFQGP